MKFRKSALRVNHRLVLGAVISSDRKSLRADLGRNPIIGDSNKILQPARCPGLRVPVVDQGPTLPLRNQDPGAFEFIELLLDRIQRHSKVAGSSTPVGISVMKQMQERRLSRETSQQIRKKRQFHDLDIRSYDRYIKSTKLLNFNEKKLWNRVGCDPKVEEDCRFSSEGQSIRAIREVSSASDELIQTLSEPEPSK